MRDAEHLSGAGVETSPAGRMHRLFRLFASRCVRFDVTTLSMAAEHIGVQGAMEARGRADALRKIVTSAKDPLAAAAGVSAEAMHYLAAVPAIDAEIFGLWLADAALAQKLGWKAPIPLPTTANLQPALRRDQDGRQPRRLMATGRMRWRAPTPLRRGGEAIDLAGALSRQTQKLFEAAPKLRARSSARVIEMMLADDSVAARAAKTARLSDRGARRLFDRLTELGAVRELSGAIELPALWALKRFQGEGP